MPAAEGDFTLEQLRRLLALELTRADASFVRSQVAARLALASDLIPGSERISAPSLEIERLELSLGLMVVRPSAPVRLWRSVRAWCLGRGEVPAPRFRFAAAHERGLQFKCVIRRDARGRFSGALEQT